MRWGGIIIPLDIDEGKRHHQVQLSGFPSDKPYNALGNRPWYVASPQGLPALDLFIIYKRSHYVAGGSTVSGQILRGQTTIYTNCTISGKSALNPSLHICKTKMITGKKLGPCPTHSHHYVSIITCKCLFPVLYTCA